MFYLYGMADTMAEGVTKATELITNGTVREWLAKHEGANYGA